MNELSETRALDMREKKKNEQARQRVIPTAQKLLNRLTIGTSNTDAEWQHLLPSRKTVLRISINAHLPVIYRLVYWNS